MEYRVNYYYPPLEPYDAFIIITSLLIYTLFFLTSWLLSFFLNFTVWDTSHAALQILSVLPASYAVSTVVNSSLWELTRPTQIQPDNA